MPAVVAGALVLSMLPARWCGYAQPLAGLVSLTTRPLTGPLRVLSARVIPQPPAPALGAARDLSEKLREQDTMLLALQRRVHELELINAELQGLKRRLGESYVYRRANVIARGADAAAGSLQLDLGTREGIRPGLAAVEGASLIGRVIQVGPAGSTLLPVTAPTAGYIGVIFAPAILPPEGLTAQRNRAWLLKAGPNERLICEDVDRQALIQVGDYARLRDEEGNGSWPAAAQGMIVGVVTAVTDNEKSPLRQRIEVRPLISPRAIDAVTIIVPRDNPSDHAGGGGGGAP